MGSRSVFTTIIRIVVPAVVSFVGGGPLAVAISSAATTAATGGSFKQSLTAGATSYLGSLVGQGIGETFSQASDISRAIGGGISAETAGAGANFGAQFLAENFPNVVQGFGDVLSSSPFFNTALGAGKELFNSAGSTGADILSSIGNQTFGQLGGKLVGVATGLTLDNTINNFLDANDLEPLKSLGFTNEQIQILSNERRAQLLSGVYDQLVKTTANPGLSDEEFKSVLSGGLNSINQNLGPVTGEQFNTIFSDLPLVSQKILSAEEQARRDAFTNKLREGFKGFDAAFQPISDDKLISRILDEQQGPAFQQVANVEARGAFNQLGGQTAKQSIERQRPVAEQRLRDIRDSILTRNQRDVEAIKNEGLTKAENFKLGDELFDPGPFSSKASSLVEERSKSLEPDIRSALGSEALFNPTQSISEAGKAQGVVSGKPSSNALLDVIASRGLTEEARKRRGVGTRGSGVF